MNALMTHNVQIMYVIDLCTKVAGWLCPIYNTLPKSTYTANTQYSNYN